MRCTGKSGFGKIVAEKLSFRFVDLDEEIYKKSGKNASEITNNGQNWQEFRKIETEILSEIIKLDNVVISCGGGCGVNTELFENNTTFGKMQSDILLNNPKTFKLLLESDIEKIISRFKNDPKSSQNRPAISNSLSIENEIILQNQYRKDKYREITNTIVDTTNAENDFYYIASEIINKINVKSNAVIGFPVKKSLSPAMHTASYQSLEINDDFSFMHLEIHPKNLWKIRENILKNNLYGISVTAPHKIEIMKYLDEIDHSATEIGAVNTIIRNEKNQLIGYNTDYIGIVKSLENIDNFVDKRIAILGSGGVALATIYGLSKICNNITIYARNIEKSNEIANKFKCNVKQIDNFNANDYDVIINCTSCGHNLSDCPINTDKINKNHIVFDLIYSPLETKLLKSAKTQGASIIYGTEMLLNQMVRQFELYTEILPNISSMRSVVDRKILENNKLNSIMSRVFISISAKTIIDLEQKIKLASNLTKNIEIRADFLENINENVIENIAKITEEMNIVFTCRKKEHGGEYIGDIYEKIINKASNFFKFIDIDFNDRRLVEKLQHRNAKIILSYHNFNNTPDLNELSAMIDKMKDGDLIKIATMVNNEFDNAILSSLITINDKIIAIGMGEIGKISRIFNILLGSKMTFSCLNDKEKTASGQINFADIMAFYQNFVENV